MQALAVLCGACSTLPRFHPAAAKREAGSPAAKFHFLSSPAGQWEIKTERELGLCCSGAAQRRSGQSKRALPMSTGPGGGGAEQSDHHPP